MRGKAMTIASLALACTLASCGHTGDGAPYSEIDCSDGLDGDGDTLPDCEDPDCVADPACAQPEDDCDYWVDDDGDTLADCGDSDCGEDPACVEPAEDCDNEADDDGDTLADCGDPDCGEDPACTTPAEDCDNGLDDDADDGWDCFDTDCETDPYCQPSEYATGVDFFVPTSSSVTIVAATDVGNREPRLLRVSVDGLPLSREPGWFFEAGITESWSFSYGTPTGTHRITLDLEGAPVWDFGDVEFAAGSHRTLLAYGGLDDPMTMTFEEPSGLAADEVVVRMVNVWDTREPLDVLICPPGDMELCSTVEEDLAYGEVWESTVSRTDEAYLGWERTPPPGYSLDRYIGASGPAGQPFCMTMGPHAGETVLSTAHMHLPYTVSLEPECLGCYGGFVLNEPFPVDMAAHPGACP